MTCICKFNTADIFFIKFTEAEEKTSYIVFNINLFFNIRFVDILEDIRNRFVLIHSGNEVLADNAFGKNCHKTSRNTMT